MHVITFGIGILGAIFHLVSGITLTSLSDFMSTKGFSLVCDVQGTITTLVRVNDPLGNIAASCFPPPSSCGSGAGNTFIRNVPAGTFTVNVIQSNVDTTNSVGNWSCTDGSQVALFPVIEIVSVTEPKISTASNSAVDGSTVTVQIDCIYPYPDEIKIEYIKESDQTFLKRATAVTFVNGTASNCPVSDARAISVTGTLTVSREGLGEHAAKIKATLLLRGKEMISGLSDFIIASSSATTESTTQLSTDRTVITTSVSETSSKMSTELLSLSTQTTVTLTDKSTLDETLPGSTESNGTKSETSTVPVTTSPSGLSEEMIRIIIILSVVGGILLVVIIVIVVFCCKQRAGTAESEKHWKKHGMLHIKNGNNKDQNSNYEQLQKIKHHAHSGRKIQGSTDSYQNHPQYDILYWGMIPTRVEYPKSQINHQEKNFPTNQHHYRNQKSPYYLPYTDPRNVMYYQRYPGSRYSEDISGYRREGPYRMQQFYLQSYTRQDRYTDDGLERRVGHRRGEYEGYWDNDTLY